MENIPLVIDLEGTLLRADLLFETGLLFLRDQPERFFAPIRWLAQGKATLKYEIAQATELDTSVLPYNEAVIRLIESERERGRRIILVTSSDRRLADQIAEYLTFFDDVIATENGNNLSAQAIRNVLVGTYGKQGFDYVGNGKNDLQVLEAARESYIVTGSPGIQKRAQRLGNVARIILTQKANIGDWRAALRLHQWLKNILIFVPLVAAHRYTDVKLILTVIVAFLCFGLCASSVYVLNDLFDLRDDRHHSRKRLRPFASGLLSIKTGLLVVPVLLISAFGLAIWALPLAYAVALSTYYFLTVAYSLVVKRRMVIDVITLAVLYTLRIIAGAVAVGIPLSFWLLAFSMFMFLSLAFVKRYAELYQARAQGAVDKARGRGYYPDDLQMIAALGAAAGYIAVMVLALYINDARTTDLYKHPEWIWLACPLVLTWISRVWMLAHRGQMNEDPVIFAAQDRISQTIFVLLIAVFWAAV